MSRFPRVGRRCAATVACLAVICCTTALAGWKDQYATARILFDEQQYAEAIGYLEQALADNPAQTATYVPHFYLGFCHYWLGDGGKAETHLELARAAITDQAQRADVERALQTIRTWRIVQPEAAAAAQDALVLAKVCLLPRRERDELRAASTRLSGARFPADATALPDAIHALDVRTAAGAATIRSAAAAVVTAAREFMAELARRPLSAGRAERLAAAVSRLEQQSSSADPVSVAAAAQDVLREAAAESTRVARLAASRRWATGVTDAAGALGRALNAGDCSAGPDLLRAARRAVASAPGTDEPPLTADVIPAPSAPAAGAQTAAATAPELRDRVRQALDRAAGGQYEQAGDDLARLAAAQSGGVAVRLHLLAGAFYHTAALLDSTKTAARARGGAEFASALASDPEVRLPENQFSPLVVTLLDEARRARPSAPPPGSSR